MNTWTSGTAKEDELAARMTTLGVREEDIEETFVRSAGPGGQNVNKTATCVALLHRPSGVQVKCQSTRQQGLNRVLARYRLLEKIQALRQARAAADRAQREKLRRQNRPRSRRSRDRMLAAKSHQATKKALRRTVDME